MSLYHHYKDRFGTTGLVIGVVALVLAMTGAAFAATGALTGKQKKEVEKIAKKFAGKPGAPGANGTNGTNGKDGASGAEGKQGPVGPTGQQGVIGQQGSTGPTGPTGTSGESVTGVAATSGECGGVSGGVKYTLKGVTTKICNGKEGAEGPAGEDGETGFTETLPSGMTETGSWDIAAGTTVETFASFAIPLAADIPGSNVAFVPKAGTPPAECKNPAHAGEASASNPEAAPGSFCVYAAGGSAEGNNMSILRSTAALESGGEFITAGGASTTGAILFVGGEVTGNLAGYFGGTWAVTAP